MRTYLDQFEFHPDPIHRPVASSFNLILSNPDILTPDSIFQSPECTISRLEFFLSSPPNFLDILPNLKFERFEFFLNP